MSDDRFDYVAANIARRFARANEFAMLTEIKSLREAGFGSVFRGQVKFDSPIEELFAAGLTYCIRKMELSRKRSPRDVVVGAPDDFNTISSAPRQDGQSLTIWGQQPIGQYRVDFLFRYSLFDQLGNIFAAIECDGHEFHEKTKEQAARDKARDNDLQSRNIAMLRYPGSVIWRDPVSAAADALQKIELIALRRLVAMGEDFGDIPLEMLAENWGRD